MQPTRPWIHIYLIFLLYKLTGFDYKYTLNFIFWVKNISLQTAKLQVHAQLYILLEKIDIYNWLGFKYMLNFIFWLEKQIPATSLAEGIYCILYFGWKNRYL